MATNAQATSAMSHHFTSRLKPLLQHRRGRVNVCRTVRPVGRYRRAGIQSAPTPTAGRGHGYIVVEGARLVIADIADVPNAEDAEETAMVDEAEGYSEDLVCRVPVGDPPATTVSGRRGRDDELRRQRYVTSSLGQ